MKFINILLVLVYIWAGFSLASYGQRQLDSLQHELRSAKDHRQKIEACYGITDFYAYVPDSVNKYAALGLALAEKKNYDVGKEKMLYKMGVSLMNLGELEKAILFLDRAMVYSKRHQNTLILGNLSRAKGLCLYRLRKFEPAVESLQAAIGYYRRIGKNTNIPTCFSVIGSIYAANGENRKAISYHLKALHIVQILRSDRTKTYSEGDREQFVTNYVDINGNLGNCYYNLGKFKIAAHYYEQAISIGEGGKNIEGHIIMMSNAAGAYHEIGNIHKADSLIRKSLGLAKKYDLKLQEGNALNYLGSFQRNIKVADSAFSKALIFAKEEGHQDLLKSIYQNWSLKAEELGDYRLALEKYKRFEELKDSLNTIEQNTKIADLQSTYKLKRSDARLKDSELRAVKEKGRVRWLASVTAFILMISIMTMVFYFRTKRLNQSLKEKSTQLEELNDFKSRAFSIIGHDVSGAISSMSAIIYILRHEGPHVEDFEMLLDNLNKLKDASTEMLNDLFIWGSSELSLQKKQLLMLPENLEYCIESATNIALAKNVKVFVKSSKSHIVYATKEHLEFIVRNLLTNAIKYSEPNGEIHLELKRHDDYIWIEVSNTGRLFDHNLMSRIFNEKVEAATGTVFEKGKGSGLLISKRIADLEGFELKLISANEVNTTVALLIPHNRY